MWLVFGFSSCTLKELVMEDEDSGNEASSMRIFLSMDSRSSEEDGFEDGVGYENFIDINNDNYRIYFFDCNDDTFIDTFKPVIHPSFSPDNDDIERGLVFNGWLFPEIGNKFKIVVLANWPAYPAEGTDFSLVKRQTTIRDLTTHVGSRFNALATPVDGGSWLGKDRLMPFYGVRSFDLTETHGSSLDSDGCVLPGKTIDLSGFPIHLIRAMAKVEVFLDHPYASFESVEMSRINKQGFSAPFQSGDSWKFDWSDYYSVSGGWSGNYMRGVHAVTDSGVSTLGFTKVSDTVNKDGSVTLEKWVAYMPEYSNHGVDPSSVIVRLKPSSVIGGSGNLSSNSDRLRSEFFFTSNGEAPPEGKYASDIERNNIYRFKIGIDGATVDIQPYTEQNLRFEFGLVRDDRGDLMILPIPQRDENGNVVVENGDTVMTYPQYFLDFIDDDNPKHKYPKEENEKGEPTTGLEIKLTDGDYYAIVVGEDEAMSNAVIWVKDRTGCHVLSNFGSADDSQVCNARLVESFFGNNQSEKFYKDIFGFRRVYHFENHNSIVIDPDKNNLLFCMIENFQQENQTRKYYEVESWDESSLTGWIINKDDKGKELGFQKITSDGLLGETVGLDGKPRSTND